MRRHASVRLSFAAALAVALVALLVPNAALAQNINRKAKAGPYSVNLKVLPAEGFTGSSSPMVHDGGAMPVTVGGPMHPNHHMVVFIKKHGKPVEDAHVEIWYRIAPGDSMMGNQGMMNNSGNGSMMNSKQAMMNSKHGMAGEPSSSGMGMMKGSGKWMQLPVARMHVRGKGAATTHFGNNVWLEPGNYEVKVSVNGKTALFDFSL